MTIENPNEGAECGEAQDIVDLCDELRAKTGFTFTACRKIGKLTIEPIYKGMLYFMVKDIKLTKDSKIESATVTLKYSNRLIQKSYFELWNIPRDRIVRTTDKLLWILDCSENAPFIYDLISMMYTVFNRGTLITMVNLL